MKKVIYIIFLFFSTWLQAQEKDIIKGVVRDKEKNPVPFVNVVVTKDEQIIYKTQADINGNYKIVVPDNLDTFIITYTFIGMEKKVIKINRKNIKDETNK